MTNKHLKQSFILTRHADELGISTLLKRIAKPLLIAILLLSPFQIINPASLDSGQNQNSRFKPLPLDRHPAGNDISEYLYYFADAQGNQTILDIISNAKLFIPLDERRFAFNVHTHWYRIEIQNNSFSQRDWAFSTGIATSPLMRAYWVSEGGIKTLLSVTDTSSFYDRPILSSSIVVPLTLKAHEKGNLFIENRSIANYPLRIKPYDRPSFQKRLINYTLINGIILGSVLMFFIFFFIQFSMQPSKMLAYYCLYILSTLFFISHVLGFNFQHLWPNHGHFNSLFTSVIGTITYCWYFMFVSELFDLRQKNKLLHNSVLSLAAITLFMTIVGFFLDTAYAMSLVALVGLPIPVLVGVWAIKQKLPSAYFFFIGSAIHCGLAYLLIIVCLGVNIGPTDYLFNIVSGGQIVDLVIISMAIAYQTKKLREQLNQHLEQRLEDMETLISAEKDKSHFLSQSERYILNLATTTHDIAQPLASIRLAIATLDDDKSAAAKQQIENTLNYTNDLIRSILKDTQTDFNDLQKQIYVSELFEGLNKRHNAFFENKNLGLRFRAKDLTVVCYPVILNRILDNLISNALRYTQKGGVLVSARRRGNDLLFQVWDSGKGMPKNQVAELLAPFKQLDQQKLDKVGYGLGLYIVKSLCVKAGYTLTVSSQEGRGSCLSILIPEAVQCLVNE